MDDCVRLAQEGKTFETRLSRHELLIEQLEYLLAYELKGIPTFSPVPSELIEKMGGYRSTIISEEIDKISDKAKKQAELTASVSSKFNGLAKALFKVQEILEGEGYAVSGNPKAVELRLLMHKAKIEGYVTEARKAEFKGNSKRAIDQYQEALFYIRNDDVDDDLQNEIIVTIEDRLLELKKPALN